MNSPLTHLILQALNEQPEPKPGKPRPGKPRPRPPLSPIKPPRGGVVGPLPPELEGQVAPLWPGLYPPGTVGNFQPLLRLGR